MFERFILWLVTKFVSVRKLTEYYVNTRFIKDPKGHIETLFHYAHTVGDRPKGFPSLQQVMLYHLHKRFTLSELAYLHALATIKKEITRCYDPSCEEDMVHTFLQQVELIKEHPNHLKVRKELIDLVRKYFFLMNEPDQVALASILQQHWLNPESATAYINQEV